jgi:hypothetical protein
MFDLPPAWQWGSASGVARRRRVERAGFAVNENGQELEIPSSPISSLPFKTLYFVKFCNYIVHVLETKLSSNCEPELAPFSQT